MKKTFNFVILILAVLVLPITIFGCGKKENPPQVVGFSVGVQNAKYTMVDGKISIPYKPEVLGISAQDFKVSLNYDDGTSMVIRQNNINEIGYTFSTTVPNNKPANVGTYTVTIGYRDFSEQIITIEVVKADFVIENIEWDYTIPYVYDGLEKIITLKNLPTGVSATYTGNRYTEPGKYTAVAQLSYIDQINYNPLGLVSIEWEILSN